MRTSIRAAARLATYEVSAIDVGSVLYLDSPYFSPQLELTIQCLRRVQNLFIVCAISNYVDDSMGALYVNVARSVLAVKLANGSMVFINKT